MPSVRTLNNGMEAQLLEQKAELKSVKDDVQLIRDARSSGAARLLEQMPADYQVMRDQARAYGGM